MSLPLPPNFLAHTTAPELLYFASRTSLLLVEPLSSVVLPKVAGPAI
jgi:hypothetical protein